MNILINNNRSYSNADPELQRSSRLSLCTRLEYSNLARKVEEKGSLLRKRFSSMLIVLNITDIQPSTRYTKSIPLVHMDPGGSTWFNDNQEIVNEDRLRKPRRTTKMIVQ